MTSDTEQITPSTFEEWAREAGSIGTEELRLGNPRAAKDFADAAQSFLTLHQALDEDSSTAINTDREAARLAETLHEVCDYARTISKVSEAGFAGDVAREVLRLAGEL